MKIKTNKVINHFGFTLVELLVVVGIVATVAAVSIPIGTRLINSAKATEAQGQMKQTIEAFRLFKEDHNSVTYGVAFTGGATSAFTCVDDDPPASGNLAAMNAHEKLYIAVDGNPNGDIAAFTKTKKKYFITPSAKDMTEASVRGGLTRDANNAAIGMIDPWGRRYYGGFDKNLEGEITTNGVAAGGSATELGSQEGLSAMMGNDVYFLMSRGADGVWGTEDDVLTHTLR